MDTKNQSVKSSHQCTSDCNNTKDCPVCPHGYDEENFCEECDEVSEHKTLDEQLSEDDFSGAEYLEGTENSGRER